MIDHSTVEKIKDAANIVDVVSEFVTLRKSGANYKGLCPFHDEKTPSFIVSPARGTCHCFGCGKGGNAISFIMEHEQMTYPEALRWLAKKYHIEVAERELTDQERQEQNERESMFIVNEWAAGYFSQVLHQHRDGEAIGMAYYRSRGFRDDIIEKFRLGFDLTDRRALAAEALRKGYKEDFLLKTGICYRNDRGELIDRYAGRVIFPWIGISGKVVGFGGRLLDARTKGVQQKYVNSPDSDIYHKERELYGIWQAKKAIAKADRVYMVEGYTDVLSMHQCGIENVVANSGTALSVHQIHTLHRFTDNITLLYDGDAAGIHAAMRGTDMLLSEGMNLKVLLLPDGDDHDSFARKHTAADFRQYIEQHQKDFIQFKTDLLLRGETDPLKRSEAINSVVQSVAMVQNPVLRDTYIHDCSTRMNISEATLINTMNKIIRDRRDGQTSRSQQGAAPAPVQRNLGGTAAAGSPSASASGAVGSASFGQIDGAQGRIAKMLMQLVIRYGDTVVYPNVETEDGRTVSLNVAQYLSYNLAVDGLSLGNELYNRILDEAVSHSDEPGFSSERFFIHHDDIAISRAATAICAESYRLTDVAQLKIEQPKNQNEQEMEAQERLERLRAQLEHLLNDFRMDYLEQRLKTLQRDIALAGSDAYRMRQLMEEYKTVHELRSKLARLLGNNIIA